MSTMSTTSNRRPAVSGRARALVATLAGVFLLLPASAFAKSAPVPEHPTALAAPAIPGAASLPGPAAPAFKEGASLGALNVTPGEGVSGAPLTISGSGLPAGKPVTLTWSTASVTWEVSPSAETVDYLGPSSASKSAVVLATTTTTSAGSFSVDLKAPDDFGGKHEIYAVIEGVSVALGAFTIARSVTISPTRGPIGTPITITYRGLGSSLYEGGAAVTYDNHFTGDATAYWTRGTAQFKIRASGPVGRHTIQVADAITFTYMNIQQSPIPWATGRALTFTVTKDRGRPRPLIEWPVEVQPTVAARTTLSASTVVAGSAATATISPTTGTVLSKAEVVAAGLEAAPVTFQWASVVGSRVNCPKTSCWASLASQVDNGESVMPSAGSLKATITVPEGLGGWHALELLQGGKVVAQTPFYVKRSVVGKGVSSLVLKEGQHFTVTLKGLGWTQLDNTTAVDYDNSYIGYGCGFNSNGLTVMNFVATGGPGTHLIDMYPMLYNSQPAYANTPYGIVPMLTYSRDIPGLALGYDLPAIRLAITIKPGKAKAHGKKKGHHKRRTSHPKSKARKTKLTVGSG
jgi:hypothetical protein